jgi:uncharacterized membrane protein (UPF0127 family)
MRLLLLILLAVPPWLTLSAQELSRIELTAGMHRIEAEVANTQEDRMRGLMQRRAMPMQRGMLFVFDADARYCMWMKNTPLPLSVAFLDGQGVILNIEEMKPQTEDTHCAAKPARYALEMNAGWFKSRGLKAGTALKGIDRAPPPR